MLIALLLEIEMVGYESAVKLEYFPIIGFPTNSREQCSGQKGCVAL